MLSPRTPQGAFAEAQAQFLRPDEAAVERLAAELRDKKMGVVAHFYMDPQVGLLTFHWLGCLRAELRAGPEPVTRTAAGAGRASASWQLSCRTPEAATCAYARAHPLAAAPCPPPSQVQGVLSAAAARWPHIHISDSLVMADAAVKMAEAGCEAVAVLGVDFMSENVRAILDEAGHTGVKVRLIVRGLVC